MTAKSRFRGRSIYWDIENQHWRYSDNHAPTHDPEAGKNCGYCGLKETKDGHDGCLGTLPWPVMNACCGHGEENLAYVQFWEEGGNGRQVVRGFAARAIQKAMAGDTQ